MILRKGGRYQFIELTQNMNSFPWDKREMESKLLIFNLLHLPSIRAITPLVLVTL